MIYKTQVFHLLVDIKGAVIVQDIIITERTAILTKCLCRRHVERFVEVDIIYLEFLPIDNENQGDEVLLFTHCVFPFLNIMKNGHNGLFTAYLLSAGSKQYNARFTRKQVHWHLTTSLITKIFFLNSIKKLWTYMEQSFGKWIKQFRLDAGLTLEMVAHKAGITKGYLWQIEEGETSNPTIQTLDRIAKALDKTVAQLLFGEALVKPADESEVDWNTIPESLRRFIESQKAQKRPPLTPEDIKVLANIHYRGQRPTTEYDWEMLYNLIKRISG